MADSPEVAAELLRGASCIVVTVASGNRSTSFRIVDPDVTLWSDWSPCPVWAREAVLAWRSTSAAIGLFGQLAKLLDEKGTKQNC